MSLRRRLALIERARSAGALIIEDDYDSEYRYSGAPVPALQGLDRHGLVLYAGSFSKVLFPSIRLGYLVVPQDLVDRVSALKSVASRFAPLLDQAVLPISSPKATSAATSDACEPYTRSGCRCSSRARDSHSSGLVEISHVEAGLQTTAWLQKGMNAMAAAAAADRGNVEVIPLSRYARRPLEREGLVLGFAAVGVEEIRRGVRELRTALEAQVT